MKNFLLLLLVALGGSLCAQTDAYHDELIDYLSTGFTLPAPTFPFASTEEQFVQRAGSYNAVRVETSAADSLPFTRQVGLDIAGGLTNRWDAGINWSNLQPIAQGDVMLMVLWLRSPTPGGGRVAIVAERSVDYVKEVELLVDLSPTWTQYLIPIEVSNGPYVVGQFFMGLHLGLREQTIEVGGWTLLNFGDAVGLDQLPSNLNVDDYGGFETDAPWRAPAARRIDSLRKSDLTVTLRDGATVLSGTPVRAALLRHDFDFGTAIKACRFPGGRCYSETFTDKIFNLDGNGHGFSAVVFENDLKWPAWEEEWISTNEQTLRTIDLLADRNVDIRGHALLWPGWDNLPDDLRQNSDDLDYLERRIDDHLVNFLQTMDLDAKIKDWDVLNETVTNTSLEERLAGTPGYVTGRELYAEVFERTRELAPDAKLYLNDYVTLTLKNGPGTTLYDRLQRNVRELLAAGAPLDGIGFQAHIGGSPNSIYEVLETYDDFATEFGLEAKVTEFDLPPSVGEDLAARYLTDFMTATFSHESMTGFLLWNFWDVDTWANPGANLFRADWSRTPAGDAFVDLVFNQWWTDDTVTTNPNGVARLRGFRGTYEITFECNGTPVTDTVSLTGDANLDYDCSDLVSNADRFFDAATLSAAPNPATTKWTITNNLGRSLSATLTDVAGRTVWSGTLAEDVTRIAAPEVAGVYLLRYTDGAKTGRLRLIGQ